LEGKKGGSGRSFDVYEWAKDFPNTIQCDDGDDDRNGWGIFDERGEIAEK